MIVKDYTDKVVLITGGTKGIGLACGLAFAKQGAQVVLTHRWGSVEESDLLAKFEAVNAKPPLIFEADASHHKDTIALLDKIGEHCDGIDVFISNVCVVMRGGEVDKHAERALIKSLEYSSWPFVDYLHRIHKRFGRYPEYAVAMSSDGPDQHYPGYDYVAVAKSVLETFVRYMATHLRKEGVKVNALRTRQVVTESYKQIFGDELVNLAAKFPEFAITAEEVADATLALCGGKMDSYSGQVLLLDRGASFVDNIMTMGTRVNEEPPKAPEIKTGLNDIKGKAVIITGGTQGIGLATAIAYGKLGARCYLTHRWGSKDENELKAEFRAAGAVEPVVMEADVSVDEDTDALLDRIKQDHDGVEVLVSNVSFAQVSPDHKGLSRKALGRSLKYSAWPFVGYLQRIKEKFGRYPRYAIGMSSRGPEYFLPGYDFVAASKAVMETYCKYLTAQLADEDIRLNIIRANPVETASLVATFGPDFTPFCQKYYDEGFFIAPEEVADASVVLSSGLMDGLKGQILLLDRGYGFNDNVVRLFQHRHAYGLWDSDKDVSEESNDDA